MGLQKTRGLARPLRSINEHLAIISTHNLEARFNADSYIKLENKEYISQQKLNFGLETLLAVKALGIFTILTTKVMFSTP